MKGFCRDRGDSGSSYNDDTGSSLIEVFLLGLGLLIPLALSISTMGNAQRGALAVSAATREAARSASAARTPSEAKDKAIQAASETLLAYGLDPSMASVQIDGELRRGEKIGVSVTYPLSISLAGIFETTTSVRLTSRSQFSVGVHFPTRR
jgi:Flp pilus assembly protein TadG